MLKKFDSKAAAIRLSRLLKKVIQRGRRRVTTGGVPSRVRWGLWWPENEVGDLFQQPARWGCLECRRRTPSTDGI